MTKLSVIVPVYNVQNYLRQCLTSLTGQSWQELEIVCVDDGSTDQSGAILREFQERDQRIRCIRQENQGLSGARNTGMAAATGEWVSFVDSDDWLEVDAYEHLLTACTDDVDLVLFDFFRDSSTKSVPSQWLNDSRQIVGEELEKLRLRLVGPLGEELRRPQLLDRLSPVWSKLYRRSVIQANGIRFHADCIEDSPFNIEYIQHCRSAYYLCKPCYHYRMNERSITRTFQANCADGFERMHQWIAQAIAAQTDPRYAIALRNRQAINVLGIGLQELNNPQGMPAIRRAIQALLERNAEVLADLDLRPMPPHWQLFYWFAKKKKVNALIFLLKVIQRLR